MGFEFNIENEPGKPFEPYGPQPRQVEFMRPAWRSRHRHSPNEGISFFKRINEADSHIHIGFARIILDCKVDVLPRFGARYDRLFSHDPVRCVTRSRSPWKYPASTGAVAAEPAPSSSISRRR